MFSTFLEAASGLLDRRFLLACWFPTFIAGAVGLFLGLIPYGLVDAWQGWQQRAVLDQTWALLIALLLVTIFAYLLQAFARPVVQWYEGYWPYRLRQWGQKRAAQRWQRWRDERTKAAQNAISRYEVLQDRLHHEYPAQAERLLSTRLGNVLRSAEDYPVTAYGMDVVFWWPRLWLLLPGAVQNSIEDAFTSLLTLLNLGTLTGIVGVGGGIYLLWERIVWWQSLAVILAGALLAWVAYRAAVAQARSYGQHIRAAVDLHRFDLLKALHQPLPATPRDERILWGWLAAWLYNQDRGVTRELAYDHAAKGKQEPRTEESDNAQNNTGIVALIQRLWRAD